MPLIVEDGTNVAGANAYVDPAGAVATAYFDAHLYATAWSNADGPTREKAVMMATRLLDANIDWRGARANESQALDWPRVMEPVDGLPVENTVPVAIAEATLELALALLTSNRSTDTAQSAAVEKLSLGNGALELSFGADPTVGLPLVPDAVFALLRRFGVRAGTGATGGMRRVLRA